MKEDIHFHTAKDVYIVAVKEWDADFTGQQWNVYLINNREDSISTVLIVSRGQSDELKTSTLRHSLGDIGAKSAAKIEFIATEVLNFTNEYLVTFFAEGRLFERNYTFRPGAINEDSESELPVLDVAGILAS